MIKNAHITIMASAELSDMRLDDLIGRRGLVIEDLCEVNDSNQGGLVLLEVPYLNEFLWFIPETSVSYE